MAKTAKEWPEYVSHKVVRAVKVIDESIVHSPFGGGWDLHTSDGGTTHVNGDWYNRHVPESATFEGGYLVKYADGYLSWSPAEAFEEGYKKV